MSTANPIMISDGRPKAVYVLAARIQSALSGEPALHYPAELVQEVAREMGGFPICAWEPWNDFQPTFATRFFVGGTCEKNENEVSHVHPDADEGFFPVSGVMRIVCRRGNGAHIYLVAPGDFLLVPPGTVHYVEKWEEPGFAYVVRSPNKATKVLRSV